MASEPKPNLKLVLSSAEISRRIQELGRQITQEMGDKELVVVGVLKGAFVFMADLIRAIEAPVKVDFVRLKSYGEYTETSGQVEIAKDVEPDVILKDRNVLVVEDIVDTGLTLAFLKNHLSQHRPAQVKICALIDKLERRERHVEVDYIGFTVEKGFLVGYGLDMAENFRHLADVYEIIS